MSEVKRPERLKIGPYTYNVTYGEPSNTQELHGYFNACTMVIRVSDTDATSKQGVCLIHEAIHALCEERDIGLDEGQITVLAPGIVQVLRDNPDLVEFAVKV